MDSNDITRRRTIGTLGAAGTIALAGCGDQEPEADDTADDTDDGVTDEVDGTFKIGVLQDYSGALPEYGEMGTTGFYSGLAYKAGEDPLGMDAVDEGDYEYTVGDIDIEIHARDTQFEAGQAQELATDLVQDEGVDFLYGVGNSGGATRVINTVVDQANVPFIMGPAAAAEITASAETCREIVFRANENTAMDALSGATYVARETDVETIALYGADDEFGRDVVNSYADVFEAEGVEIVEQRFMPSGFAEWEGILEDAEEIADGFVGGFTAATLVPLMRTLVQMRPDLHFYGGLAARVTLNILGGVLAEELDELTEEALQDGIGPLTTRYHWNQWDNPINDEFNQMHLDAYDRVPDLFTSGAFVAASSMMQALQEEGEVSGDAAVAGMRGMTVTDTPKGENAYEFQAYNNQARSAMTLADLIPTEDEGWEPAIQPGEPIHEVPASETTLPEDHERVTCDL